MVPAGGEQGIALRPVLASAAVLASVGWLPAPSLFPTPIGAVSARRHGDRERVRGRAIGAGAEERRPGGRPLIVGELPGDTGRPLLLVKP